MPKDIDRRDTLATAGLKDRIAFVADVVAPTLAKGPLVRRPRVVSVAERLDLDARAVRRMAALRDTYGDGPLLVPVPGRTHAVILSPSDARRVLEETPDPFMPATDEKRAALAHFEPKVSLASRGAERVDRRRFNDSVLENDRPVHSMADAMLPVVEEEAARLLRSTGRRLDWDGFVASWYRVVRRIVLGREAGDDHELTDILETLRRHGNLVILARKRRDLLDRFRARVEDHLDRAEPGSLAERIAALPKADATAPADQVAHYLFAFDPGGMATFRALALLAAHPGAADRAREEVAAADAGPGRAMLPYLRATLLESLRLWPTTPVILRQATRDLDFGGATLPKGANVIVYAPFFHRDEGLSFAPLRARALARRRFPRRRRGPPRLHRTRGALRARALQLRPGALPGERPRADDRERDARGDRRPARGPPRRSGRPARRGADARPARQLHAGLRPRLRLSPAAPARARAPAAGSPGRPATAPEPTA
jgi:cytochrome P450